MNFLSNIWQLGAQTLLFDIIGIVVENGAIGPFFLFLFIIFIKYEAFYGKKTLMLIDTLIL
jgi:hypothetical protein